MIVFANGAIKSGSTWLMHVARELGSYQPPPANFANPSWTSEPIYSVDPGRLGDFLDKYGNMHQDFLSKNHFSKRRERERLLHHPQVRVLNIRRDIRDVVVSAYYHRQAPNRKTPSEIFPGFDQYYWKKGRAIAMRVLDFQILWDVHSPRYFCVEYEAMLSDFATQAAGIGHFLGLQPDADDLERVKCKTSPATLNAQYRYSDLNRFRQGTVGDWRNHFDDDIAADVAALVRRSQDQLYRQAVLAPRLVRRLLRHWYR